MMYRRGPYVVALAGLLLGVVGCSTETGVRVETSGRAETSERADGGSPLHADSEFVSDDGTLTVDQVRQMSVVIGSPAGVVYTDPTGGAARYAEYPPPTVILISHEHHEHYDIATLEDLVGPDTRLVVPPNVMEDLPPSLQGNAVSLANGERSGLGAITVDAVPAYGVSAEAAQWHPPGRGNGYVVAMDGRTLYVAGSTEATREMLDLDDIYLALLPLYPPYALGPDDAVAAVGTFLPEFTYIYQYSSEQVRDDFVRGFDDASKSTVVIAPDI